MTGVTNCEFIIGLSVLIFGLIGTRVAYNSDNIPVMCFIAGITITVMGILMA